MTISYPSGNAGIMTKCVSLTSDAALVGLHPAETKALAATVGHPRAEHSFEVVCNS